MSETQKDNRTQEWAERVGREAVELGMPWQTGLYVWDTEAQANLRMSHDDRWPRGYLPDFRDRLTELACIAWVEDVAREVYGEDITIVHRGTPGEWSEVAVSSHGDRSTLHPTVVKATACKATLAEACIAAVRAMKGANQ